MEKKRFFPAFLLVLAACGAKNEVAIRSSVQPQEFNSTYDDADYVDDDALPIPADAMDEESFDEKKVEPVPPVKDIARPDVAAVAKGYYKIGNPYLIDGVPYYPHEDFSYNEIGTASWYGPDFTGGKTSNGEVFDETKFTAAHRTLPMPSLVRVTNLENGASVTVKVNDRGPFARNRILDVSSATAEVLGMKEKGSAKVRVELLSDESQKIKYLAQNGADTDIYGPDISYNSVITKPYGGEQDVLPPPPAKKVESKDASLLMPVEPVIAESVVQESVAPKTAVPNLTGEYFVQVAAYNTYDKAEALKNKLSSIGDVKIFKAVQGGQTLYKVRLGEFADKAAAANVQSSVEAAGITGSRIVLKDGSNLKWQ